MWDVALMLFQHFSPQILRAHFSMPKCSHTYGCCLVQALSDPNTSRGLSEVYGDTAAPKRTIYLWLAFAIQMNTEAEVAKQVKTF